MGYHIDLYGLSGKGEYKDMKYAPTKQELLVALADLLRLFDSDDLEARTRAIDLAKNVLAKYTK